jgi:hypothetical protein
MTLGPRVGRSSVAQRQRPEAGEFTTRGGGEAEDPKKKKKKEKINHSDSLGELLERLKSKYIMVYYQAPGSPSGNGGKVMRLASWREGYTG